MTNKRLTEKVIILDRSGSMMSCKNDMEGGLNSYIEEQKKSTKNDGIDCRITYVTFDDEIVTELENVDIKVVGSLQLIPRGSTALLDAIGKTLNSVGERLAKTAEKDRPGLVDVIIITDGGENASTEFNNKQIKQMITTQEDVYGWQFTFLGANQDSFAAGGAMGFKSGKTANYSVDKSNELWKNVSSRSTRMSKALVEGGDVELASMYSASERNSMV